MCQNGLESYANTVVIIEEPMPTYKTPDRKLMTLCKENDAGKLIDCKKNLDSKDDCLWVRKGILDEDVCTAPNLIVIGKGER
jgi:hypothetical protein